MTSSAVTDRGVRVERDSLTVAMAIVPGVLPRNRHFALHRDPDVRHARTRAALVRGLVRQLSGAYGPVEGVTVSSEGDARLVSFAIAPIRLQRRVVLTRLEAACVAWLASRGGVNVFPATDDDRALVEGALRRLGRGLDFASDDVAARGAE